MKEIVKALDYDNNNMTLTKAFKEGFALASTLNSRPQYTPIQILDMWGEVLLESMEVVNVEGHQYEMLLNYLVMLGVEV